MTDKGFVNIINTVSQFNETQSLLKVKVDLVRKTKRIKRRLRTLKKKYLFLKTIIETNDSTTLELAIKDYFKAVGYENVVHTGNNTEREDIQVWHENTVYIIECRNKETKTASKDDIGQLNFRKSLIENLPEFKGHTLKYIMVLNNQWKYPPEKRNKNPLNIVIEKSLKHYKNSLVTTMELYDAFIKFKQNKITFSHFDKKLNQVGLIKF